MLARFGVTLFLGAALLFAVEPLVARMLMPLLGGAPAVWITCMLFFQAVLLLGYAYAHATTAWLGLRPQAVLHLALLPLPLFVLPIAVSGRSRSVLVLDQTSRPALELLLVLATTVGLPFFVLSTTTPLLQRWFSRLGHAAGDDPYFLYAASNIGSLIALAAYPAVIEPSLGLSLQSQAFRWGYVAFACAAASCAVSTLVSPTVPETPRFAPSTEALTPARRARWVALAFVPSTFLLGVTSYITTDVASIPLFWVVPLALYLLSFILVFARCPPFPHAAMVRVLPFGVTATVMMVLTQASTPMPIIVVVHLVTFFVAAMVCHGALARDRPAPSHLTEFYLCVSIGGALGGVWNGVVAPGVFDRLVEYPLAMVLAAICRPAAPDVRRTPGSHDAVFAVCLCLLAAGLVRLGKALAFDPSGHMFPLLFGVPLFVNYSQLARPRRFALGLLATLVGGVGYGGPAGETIHIERNFFGVLRVTRDPALGFVQIAHGNTIHGRQRIDPAHRDVPSGYYTRSGPLGQVFDAFRSRAPSTPAAVAVIGLGAGGMASYARSSDRWTYFEINPAVVRVATDPRYFTFLRDAFPDPSHLSIVLGDARLRLDDSADAAFDLLAVDAFSSDAIPTHLLTREAVLLYLRKLRPGGLLVVHISNRYLDLEPVVSSLASVTGLTGRVRRDGATVDPDAFDAGWTPSDWVVLARAADDLGTLARDRRWTLLSTPHGKPWTDDFSNLLGAYR